MDRLDWGRRPPSPPSASATCPRSAAPSHASGGAFPVGAFPAAGADYADAFAVVDDGGDEMDAFEDAADDVAAAAVGGRN